MKVDVFVGVWFGRGVLAFGVMCHVAVTGSVAWKLSVISAI